MLIIICLKGLTQGINSIITKKFQQNINFQNNFQKQGIVEKGIVEAESTDPSGS